jgi:predicted transcriptional regulator
MKVSDKEREVIEFVNGHPGMTATELSKMLHKKLATFSGQLTKMCNGGLLVRRDGVGPRGGYGYFTLPTRDKDQDMTAWQHIMADD